MELPVGLLWITLLCPGYVSAQTCSGKPPVFDPSIVVVNFGDPVSVTCQAQYKAEVMGWDTSVGATVQNNTQQLNWSVDSVKNWSLSYGISCFSVSKEHGKCWNHLPITIYKTPDRVTLRLVNRPDQLVEGEQYFLECVVESVSPVDSLTVVWFKGDTELESTDYTQLNQTDNGDTLWARKGITASRDDHDASYSCAARLDLKTADPIPDKRSNSIQLKFDDPTRLIIIIIVTVAALVLVLVLLTVIWRKCCRKRDPY